MESKMESKSPISNKHKVTAQPLFLVCSFQDEKNNEKQLSNQIKKKKIKY